MLVEIMSQWAGVQACRPTKCPIRRDQRARIICSFVQRRGQCLLFVRRAILVDGTLFFGYMRAAPNVIRRGCGCYTKPLLIGFIGDVMNRLQASCRGGREKQAASTTNRSLRQSSEHLSLSVEAVGHKMKALSDPAQGRIPLSVETVTSPRAASGKRA